MISWSLLKTAGEEGYLDVKNLVEDKNSTCERRIHRKKVPEQGLVAIYANREADFGYSIAFDCHIIQIDFRTKTEIKICCYF